MKQQTTEKEFLYQHFINEDIESSIKNSKGKINFYTPFFLIVIVSFIAVMFSSVAGYFWVVFSYWIPYVDGVACLILIVNIIFFLCREHKVKLFKKRFYSLLFALEFPVESMIFLLLIFSEKIIDYPFESIRSWLFPLIYTALYILCFVALICFTFFAWFVGCSGAEHIEIVEKNDEIAGNSGEMVNFDAETSGLQFVNRDSKKARFDEQFINWKHIKNIKTQKQINNIFASHMVISTLSFSALLIIALFVASRMDYYEYIVGLTGFAVLAIMYYFLGFLVSEEQTFRIFKKPSYSFFFCFNAFLLYLVFFFLIVSAPKIPYPINHFEFIYLLMFFIYFVGYSIFSWHAFGKALTERSKEIDKENEFGKS